MIFFITIIVKTTDSILIGMKIVDAIFVNDKWVTPQRFNGDEGTGGEDYGLGFKKELTLL